VSQVESVAMRSQASQVGPRPVRPNGFKATSDLSAYVLYALALAVSISTWFFAIRAPLWLDETVSYFVIKGRFSEIMSRQGWPGVPAYPYLLWFWVKAVCSGEVALRISSVLAMLGAVYLLYCSARELFNREAGVIAAIVFCLHPLVDLEAVDVRPYAFAALAITGSIYALVQLQNNDAYWRAVLFGLSAAFVVYFQFLFVVIVPALVVCFFALRIGWRQFGVALVAFAIAFLPVVPGLNYMFHTSGVHVFDHAPAFWELRSMLAPKVATLILSVIFLIAAMTRRLGRPRHFEGRKGLFCASLALVPILILYGVSVGTSVHIFASRYRIVAVPGIALCWALLVSLIGSRTLRLLFSLALVAATSYQLYRSPLSRAHLNTWKYALDVAEKNASADNAPVLICSDLPESDHMAMPIGVAVKDSAIFAPLSYYPLSVPVVGLPRGLNQAAMRDGSEFLQEAARHNERFLALANDPSYPTLDWLADQTESTYQIRELGIFDLVKVLEFVPVHPQNALR
jgi:uncharacterized membrane protein